MRVRADVNEEALRKLWTGRTSIVQIAARLGVMEWDVIRAARALKLPPRSGRALKGPCSAPADPTQFEIEQRSQMIRDRWSPQELRRRAVGGRSQHYEVPTFEFSQRRR
jgi:hypothetical protein